MRLSLVQDLDGSLNNVVPFTQEVEKSQSGSKFKC